MKRTTKKNIKAKTEKLEIDPLMVRFLRLKSLRTGISIPQLIHSFVEEQFAISCGTLAWCLEVRMSTQKIGTASDAELEKAEQELDDYFDSRKKNPKYYKRPSKDAGYIVMGATA